jgi:mevalonate pyrophosphate decarboxylase
MATKLEELKTKIEVAIQALEGIMVDPTWGLEHETYMRCRVALRKLKEENPMTKLEELKAAIDDTYAAAKAAAYDTSAAAWAAYVAACDAYYDELNKKQEENSND